VFDAHNPAAVRDFVTEDGEGDLVVIAGALPQPDGAGGTFTRMLYDAFRVRDGMLVEHWSGVDARNPPKM
jgi:predicted SnoaL-like aldol condensation-catalyzing enzyme